MKIQVIICADLESLLEKKNTCHNNPEESSTTKINKHAPSSFTYCSFDTTKSRLDCYRGKNFMKHLRIDLKEHAAKIIDYKKKKQIIPLTKKEKKIHREQKVCYICKKGFSADDGDNKKYFKVRSHCHYTGKYRGAAHDICNLRYKTSKQIPVGFHNGSTYDYHFIIKELALEFEGKFE